MNLPELPRVIKKHESTFAEGVFAKWLIKNPRYSNALETKDTRGKTSFPFKEVTDEQLNWALAISGDKGALIRVRGLNGQPDYIWARNMPYYIVIKYPNFFCLIDPNTFILERDRSKRRSLTAGRARDISIVTIDL